MVRRGREARPSTGERAKCANLISAAPSDGPACAGRGLAKAGGRRCWCLRRAQRAALISIKGGIRQRSACQLVSSVVRRAVDQLIYDIRPRSRHGRTGPRRMGCARLRRVTETCPRQTRTRRDGCCCLTLIGGILSGTGRQALTYMRDPHFPTVPVRMSVYPSGEPPADAIRAALATLASYTATPDQGVCGDMGGLGRAGRSTPQAPRVEILIGAMLPFTGPVEALRDAPALAWYGFAAAVAQAPHPSGRRIKPGAWPARSTRRSSSPWVVPATRAQALARALPGAIRQARFGEPAPIYRDPAVSHSIRSSARSRVRL